MSWVLDVNCQQRTNGFLRSIGHGAALVACACSVNLALSVPTQAQQSTSADAVASPAPSSMAEAGGRLVVTGDTVIVTRSSAAPRRGPAVGGILTL